MKRTWLTIAASLGFLGIASACSAADEPSVALSENFVLQARAESGGSLDRIRVDGAPLPTVQDSDRLERSKMPPSEVAEDEDAYVSMHGSVARQGLYDLLRGEVRSSAN